LIGSSWEPVLRKLQQHLRLVLVDNRGSAGSDLSTAVCTRNGRRAFYDWAGGTLVISERDLGPCQARAWFDPLGRELLISCGAALFGLRLGLRSLGYRPAVELLPDRRGFACSPASAWASQSLLMRRSAGCWKFCRAGTRTAARSRPARCPLDY
jgi:hypothetical protein